MTTSWIKLADLNTNDTRIVSIRPRHRTYIHQADAGYDWACGREFVVISDNCPYYGAVVAVDERHHLKRHGYTHVHIHYNIHCAPLEVEL